MASALAAEMFPHVARAEAWARAVIAGKIPNCEWVRLACQRHLDDLKKSKKRGTDFRFYFDPAAGQRVCKFIEALPLTKGRWASDGSKFKLEDWQCFLTVVLFGWLRRADDKRRFRRAFILIPRKNGKSEWAGALGLYMLCADREFGAEVYSGATTEKQAGFVFGAARQMAMRTPKLQSAFGLTVNASNLHIVGNNSKFEAIIGKPGDGASPSLAVIDEYHEHDSDAQVDAMETGMGAREQPLLLIITTAGDNIAGPCYQAQLEAQKILSGVIVNDAVFACMFGLDKGDDWTKVASLRKANPNLGVSVKLDFLQDQLNAALTNPRKAGAFKTKHLNEWVQSRAAFFPVQRWLESEDAGLTLESFAGQPCFLGLDLASKVDVASLVAIFKAPGGTPEKPRWALFARHYLPSETVEDPAAENYQGWASTIGHNGGPALDDDGRVTWPKGPRMIVTEGAIIDFDRIKADILAFSKAFQVECVAYDPHQATQLVTQLMTEGVPVLEFRPTVLNFSEPMKEIEAVMRERRIAHDGDPVMSWMLSNVVAREDAKENVYPRKDAPANKIDGAIAAISAWGAMKVAPQSTESVYATRGLIELEA